MSVPSRVDRVLRKAVRPTVEVDLRRKRIKGADVDALCVRLNRMQPTTLLLSHNDVDDEGGLRLAASLRDWKRLQRLELKLNFMTFASLAKIASAVKRNPMIETLAIDFANCTPDEICDVKRWCLLRTWVTSFNQVPKKKQHKWAQRNVEKHRVLALMSANRRACHPSVERFLARDGDHAVCTRVLKFLMFKA